MENSETSDAAASALLRDGFGRVLEGIETLLDASRAGAVAL